MPRPDSKIKSYRDFLVPASPTGAAPSCEEPTNSVAESSVDPVVADLVATLRFIVAQAKKTAETFPNAPGVGDWRTVERFASAAIVKATK